MRYGQKGSSIVEVLLIVVVIGLAGGLGFYTYHRHHAKNTMQHTATNSQVSEALTQATASKMVMDFYGKYTKLNPPGHPQTEETLLQQYGTANLLAYYKNNQHGVDPIVCAQAFPKSMTIANSRLNQGVATVTLNEAFTGQNANVTLTVVQQGGLKIDTLKCATPLPAGEGGGP